MDYIIRKAQRKLFCLNILRRSKLSPKDIITIYCSKVRPIVEYAAPVWHSGLTREQSESLEDIQVRACRIALPGIDYESALKDLEIPSLELRRQTICKSFFLKMQQPTDKLFRILPERKANRNNTRN